MPRQESVGDIHEWIEDETRHIDVIASWESLNDTYDMLKLTDPMSDMERLDEYRWIVQQMNTFLTKTRKLLLSCKDTDAMMEALWSVYKPVGKVDLSTRKAFVFQKLRQQWVGTTIRKLQMTMQDEKEEEDG